MSALRSVSITRLKGRVWSATFIRLMSPVNSISLRATGSPDWGYRAWPGHGTYFWTGPLFNMELPWGGPDSQLVESRTVNWFTVRSRKIIRLRISHS
jgi:hypothetical protein